MLKKYLFIFFLFSNLIVTGQALVPRDSLLADFKVFIHLLEETHPDPYSSFDGKVFFSKSVKYVESSIPEEGISIYDFANLLNSFLANLHDGHTYVSLPIRQGSQTGKFVLPLKLKAASDGLFISSIDEGNKQLLGSRIVSVNNIVLDSLMHRVSTVNATENLYQAYSIFQSRLSTYDYWKLITPGLQKELTIEVETPDNTIEKLVTVFVHDSVIKTMSIVSTPDWDKVPTEKYMYYQYIDTDKQTMIFHLESIMAREAFQLMKKGNPQSFSSTIKRFYDRILKEDMPADDDEAIAAIPSLAEIFRNMLQEMKANKSKNLVIDLRNNDGGYTPIILPTLYMLFGDQYFEKQFNPTFYTRISPLFLKKNNLTLEDFNKFKDSNYEMGDYHFNRSNTIEEPVNVKREEFINEYDFAKDYISSLNGKPIFKPERIFVITNNGTFSAAFHYAFYLWKMGATVVGVPSAQSPNTFMEITPFELPITKLKGSFSNSLQVFLPSDDKRSNVFYPDKMMIWRDYLKYNFNKQAELLFTLDLLSR